LKADPAVIGQVVEQRDSLLAAAAGDPAAPVHLEDRGARLCPRRLGRHVDVEAQRPATVAGVLDPAQPANAARPQHQGRDQEVADRKSRAPRVGGRLQLGERLAHPAGAGECLPCEPHQRDHRHCQQHDRHDAEPDGERPEPDGERERDTGGERERPRELAHHRARHPTQEANPQGERRAHPPCLSHQLQQAREPSRAVMASSRCRRRPCSPIR
jgi:hypothetical protein